MSNSSTSQEALKAAVDAIEQCMRALRVATDENEKARLDQQCRTLLAQAEHIKTSEASTDQCSDQLVLGQELRSSTIRPKLREPLSGRELSTREQIILLDGSKLNGFVFPPWKNPPDPHEFELRDGQDRFLYVG